MRELKQLLSRQSITMIRDSTFDNVRDELPLNEFLNYEREGDNYKGYETVHIVPVRKRGETSKIRVYRLIGDTDNGNYDRIRTTISGVTFKLSTFGDRNARDIKSWSFQSGDGETILTLLDALKNERSQSVVRITYYEENNWPALEDTPVDNETFQLKYETNSGRSNMVKIDNVHSGHDTNYNANFR